MAVEGGLSLFAAEGLADKTTVMAVSGSWVEITLGAAYTFGSRLK